MFTLGGVHISGVFKTRGFTVIYYCLWNYIRIYMVVLCWGSRIKISCIPPHIKVQKILRTEHGPKMDVNYLGQQLWYLFELPQA